MLNPDINTKVVGNTTLKVYMGKTPHKVTLLFNKIFFFFNLSSYFFIADLNIRYIFESDIFPTLIICLTGGTASVFKSLKLEKRFINKENVSVVEINT